MNSEKQFYPEDDIVVKNDTVLKEGVVDIITREDTQENFVDEEASEDDAVNRDKFKTCCT